MTPLPWTGERFVPHLDGDIAYEHFHRYALATGLATGKVVLDLASGEGYGSSLLAGVARVVVGVDFDPIAVGHARQAYRADNLSFLVGSCERIPLLAQSVDLVVSFETLEHHDRQLEMMSEVRRVLRPDGVFIVSTPDRRVYSDLPGYANPFHVRELYAPEFEQLLRTFFDNVVVYGQRMVHGSLIAPLDHEKRDPFWTYGGRYGQVRRVPGLADAVYLIGLAWNGADPPPLPISLFDLNRVPSEVQVKEPGPNRPVRHRNEEDHRAEYGAAITSPDGSLANLKKAHDEHVATIERITSRLDGPSNDTDARLAAVRDELWYWREVQRIRAAVDRCIPTSARVTVVSRGDDRLLQLGERRVVHFPRADDGSFMGWPPPCDDDAIDRLRAARDQGIEYFLIPGYDQWLLDDYPAFGRHIRANYRRLESADPAAMIFALRD
jgi:SAM-dependent methyltransferase